MQSTSQSGASAPGVTCLPPSAQRYFLEAGNISSFPGNCLFTNEFQKEICGQEFLRGLAEGFITEEGRSHHTSPPADCTREGNLQSFGETARRPSMPAASRDLPISQLQEGPSSTFDSSRRVFQLSVCSNFLRMEGPRRLLHR